MNGPTCIYCKHCTVQQVRGVEQLVCTVDRAKQGVVVVVSVMSSCSRFRPDPYAEFADWPGSVEVW